MRLFQRKRRPRYDPVEVNKMVLHYERMVEDTRKNILRNCSRYEALATAVYGTSSYEEAMERDGVYQGLRDNLGFWRIQQRDMED